jgi:5-methylcytosine-specific restriction endonuclease McrA
LRGKAPRTWQDRAKEQYENGVPCAAIAKSLGLATATVEQQSYTEDWQRKQALCSDCGVVVPLGIAANRAVRRVCEPCRKERKKTNPSRTKEAKRAARERFTLRHKGRLPLTKQEMEYRWEQQRKKAPRRQRPAVQLGRFRHYGEPPTTREGALAVLTSTLIKLLDVRCSEDGIARCSVEYTAKYRTNDLFRQKQKVKSVKSRVRREKMPSDGTLTSLTTQALFAAAKCCAYCDKPISGKDKTLDHMHPLSLGGLHSMHNAVICCYSCNSRKHAVPFDQWLTRINPDIAARFHKTERVA